MIFDGPNLLIILEASDGDSVGADAMYSRWKDWVYTSDGSAYPRAFDTIGGEDLGGGLSAGSYFFLRTQDGWRVRPREADQELAITGGLYPADPADPLFVVTLGTFQVRIFLERSQLTQAIESGGGGTIDLTEITTMLREIHQAYGLDPSNPVDATDTTIRVPADGSIIDQTITDLPGGIKRLERS